MAIGDNTLYGLTGAQIKELPGKIEAVKGTAKELTSADYDYPANNPDGIALWKLPKGLYYTDPGVKKYISASKSESSSETILIGIQNDTNVSITIFGDGVSIGFMRRFAVNSEAGTEGTSVYSYGLTNRDIIDSLTSAATDKTLSANQGKVLKDLIDGLIISGTGAPTTSTAGTKGKLYEDTTNGKLYQCTNVSGNTYTWTPISTTNITSRTSGSTSVPVQNLDLAGDPSTNKPYALKSVVNGNEQSWGYLRGGIAAGGSRVGTAYAGVYSYDGNEDVWQSAESRLALYEDLDGRVKQNAGAPTTSTVGSKGQLLEDTTNGKLYQCTAVTPGTDPDPDTYTWTEVGAGGSGPTVVQTTGTSQTDVMSQNAVTSMVFADPSIKQKVQIGAGASASNGIASIAIGNSATTNNNSAIALGRSSSPSGRGSVAIGAFATTPSEIQGVVGFGSTNTAYGYNSSNYRLLTGLYDPQNAHDAATKGYVDNSLLGKQDALTAGSGISIADESGSLVISTTVAEPDEFTSSEWNALWS